MAAYMPCVVRTWCSALSHCTFAVAPTVTGTELRPFCPAPAAKAVHLAVGTASATGGTVGVVATGLTDGGVGASQAIDHGRQCGVLCTTTASCAGAGLEGGCTTDRCGGQEGPILGGSGLSCGRACADAQHAGGWHAPDAWHALGCWRRRTKPGRCAGRRPSTDDAAGQSAGRRTGVLSYAQISSRRVYTHLVTVVLA